MLRIVGATMQVSHEFRSRKDAPVLGKNAAPHSGAVAWARGLRDRITGGASSMEEYTCNCLFSIVRTHGIQQSMKSGICSQVT